MTERGICLTPIEACRLHSGDKVYIVRNGVGKWETVAQIYAWMDMNYLDLQSGGRLDLEEYGRTWTAYTKIQPMT